MLRRTYTGVFRGRAKVHQIIRADAGNAAGVDGEGRFWQTV